MQTYRLPALLLAFSLVTACSQKEQPVVEVDAAAELNAIYAAYNEENLALNPVLATFRGDARYNDQWGIDTLSDEYLEADLEMQRRFYDRATAIDPDQLTGQDRLSYDIFVLARQDAIESHEKGFTKLGQLLPINQLFSTPTFLAQLGSGSSAQQRSCRLREMAASVCRRQPGFNRFQLASTIAVLT